MRLRVIALLALLALWPRPVADAMAVGEHPAARASLVGGGEFDLRELAGSVVLIDFWATWCGPCEQSFPVYAELQERYRDDGLVVVAVSVDERLRDVERFLSRRPVPFQVAWDADQSLVEEFAPPTMPTAYLVDRAGHVRHVIAGFRESEIAQTEALLVELLSEAAPASTAEPAPESTIEAVPGPAAEAEP